MRTTPVKLNAVEIALLLNGLDAIFVADYQKEQKALDRKLVREAKRLGLTVQRRAA